MSERRGTQVEQERESGTRRTASALFLDMGFAPREEARQIKWAWAWALGFHFALFAVVMPTPGTAEFAFDKKEVMVIRRYEPPEIERPEKPRRRKKAPAVPIPDPTPDAFEPIISRDEMLDFAPPEEADVRFSFGGPSQVGPPAQAVAIETDGLVLPALLEQFEPEYDGNLARRGVQGAADVEIVINTEGVVSMARVINSTTDDTLDQAALDAVRKWIFEPGMLDGVLVPVRAVVTINFRVY